MSGPVTDAGKALLVSLSALVDGPAAALFGQDTRNRILAIEAEARSQGLEAARAVIEPAVERAEALRDAGRAEASAELLALREALGTALDFISNKSTRPSDEYAQAWAPLAVVLANTAEAAEQAKAQIEAPWRDVVNRLIHGINAWDEARALLEEAER